MIQLKKESGFSLSSKTVLCVASVQYLKGQDILIKASKKGDAAILKELIKILAKEKINVISSIYFNPELSLNKGTHSILKPNSKDLIDIKNGLKILKNLISRINQANVFFVIML